MKRASLCVVLVCAAIATACGARNNASNSAGVAGSNSNKISFGMYDISSGGPYSMVTSALSDNNAPAETPAVANATASGEREMNSPDTSYSPTFDTAQSDR